MAVLIYKGKNPPGSSMALVADNICAGIPGSVVIRDPTEIKAGDTVVNIIFGQTSKLETVSRYVGKFKLIGLFASNVEEHSDGELLEAALNYMKYPLVLHSKYHYKSFFEVIARYFQPSIVRKLKSNTSLLLYGIEDGFSIGGHPDFSKNNWIVPVNRIHRTQKRITEHADITKVVSNVLASRGQVVKSDVYLMDSKMSYKENCPAIYNIINQPASREEYKYNARKYGMFLCTSKYESFGIYYLELLLSGVVGVFVEEEWNNLLLEWYPLKVKSLNDVKSMMIHVYDNYDKYRRLLESEWAPRIKAEYSLARFQTAMKDLVLSVDQQSTS